MIKDLEIQKRMSKSESATISVNPTKSSIEGEALISDNRIIVMILIRIRIGNLQLVLTLIINKNTGKVLLAITPNILLRLMSTIER